MTPIRQARRGPAWPFVAGGALLAGVMGGAAAAGPGPRLRGVTPPQVTIHSADPRYEEAQTRLASFIIRLQTGQRRKATELMSARVTPEERRSLVQKKWLRSEPWRRGDFLQALYWHDVQIETHDASGSLVNLQITRRVQPYINRKTSAPAGLVVIPMRRENGQWWVDLHPPRRVSG